MPGISSKDQIYNDLRDISDIEYIVSARQYLESLWQEYAPYADPDFQQNLALDTNSRVWEMYLTCTLLKNHLPVRPKKEADGPDILIEQGENRIWIEAITPSKGEEGNPDTVPEMLFGVVQRVPDEQITLRYRSAIEDKYKKYRQYLEQGTIRPPDAYIVALNSCKIENAGAELYPPRIVKAVFPIGYPQITIDKNTHKVLGEGHQLRYYLKKTRGSIVSTDVFLDMEYRHLSGVLYSRAGICHFPDKIGGDFVFVHNPLTVNRIPHRFIPCEQEYIAEKKQDSWEIGPL